MEAIWYSYPIKNNFFRNSEMFYYFSDPTYERCRI